MKLSYKRKKFYTPEELEELDRRSAERMWTEDDERDYQKAIAEGRVAVYIDEHGNECPRR